MSFDSSDFERLTELNTLDIAHREDKYTFTSIYNRDISDTHKIALGTEFQYGEYGLPSRGFPNSDASSLAFSRNSLRTPRWSTETYSLFAEDQYEITSWLKSYSGIRWDRSSYVSDLYSPRVALVSNVDESNIVKLMASQAMKMNFQEELRYGMQTTGTSEDKPERLRSLEASLTHLISKDLSVSLNSFYNQLRITGYTIIESAGSYQTLGEQEFIGGEVELNYNKKRFNFGVSHSISKQLDFNNATSGQSVTAKPFGFGNDTSFFPVHTSKFHTTYRITDKFSATASTRIFWGWDGYEDYTNWQNEFNQTNPGYVPGARDPSFNPYDDIQMRINLGANYELSNNISLGLFAYNLAGLWDKDNGKRFQMFSASAREEPTAFRITLDFKL